jgi:CHAT domain-containing protein
MQCCSAWLQRAVVGIPVKLMHDSQQVYYIKKFMLKHSQGLKLLNDRSHNNSIAVDFVNQLAVAGIIH